MRRIGVDVALCNMSRYMHDEFQRHLDIHCCVVCHRHYRIRGMGVRSMKRKTAMFKTAAAAMFIVSATFVGMGASNAYPTPSVDDTPIVNVMEDDPNWDCVTMGNRVCGVGNAEGVPAGCYNDNEELVAPWPCFVVVDDDGNADVYKVGNITRMWGE